MKPDSRRNYLLLILCIIAFLLSCHSKDKHINRAFYYWKTKFSLSSSAQQRLEDLKIQKLYIRFFDITLSPTGEAVPVAKADLREHLSATAEIIPVVFITNKSLEKIGGNTIDTLAGSIVSLVEKTATVYKINYTELQLDCDWTLLTKAKYFALLQSVKKKLPSKKLSCTIRLHQVKYFGKTGIPPVDRGMLMFYNMGQLQDTLTNSIFNTSDAGKYVSSIKNYPLPLDVALPIFGWVKHYRGNRIIGLMSDLTETDLKQHPYMDLVSGHRYTCTKSIFFRGEYLQERDMLVAEEITPTLAIAAAELVEKNLKGDSFTVVLYHWDSLNLSRYANKDIEDIYHHF